MHPSGVIRYGGYLSVTSCKHDAIKYGITDGLIRMSVGIENIEDLEADLTQALAKASL